jgi:uncharacterized protein YqgC (DUF456 family)
MSAFIDLLQNTALTLGFMGVWLLCLLGVILSCLSVSGTWLVTAAAVVAAILTGSGFPGLGTILLFVYLSVLVEVGEMVAGYWGVARRGGSSWAGFAALVGGLAGLAAGSIIPIPVVGSLIGMMGGSFALVYAVERMRARRVPAAAHIAMGAVVARFAVILLKVVVTLGMIAWLVIGLTGK